MQDNNILLENNYDIVQIEKILEKSLDLFICYEDFFL